MIIANRLAHQRKFNSTNRSLRLGFQLWYQTQFNQRWVYWRKWDTNSIVESTTVAEYVARQGKAKN